MGANQSGDRGIIVHQKGLKVLAYNPPAARSELRNGSQGCFHYDRVLGIEGRPQDGCISLGVACRFELLSFEAVVGKQR